MKGNGLKNALLNLKQFFIKDFDDIFDLYKSTNHLEKSRNYFNICYPNMSFSVGKKKMVRMPYFDGEISREKGKIVTTVYRKPTFSGIYNHFESSLLSSDKFAMLYTLVYRCFTLWSDWTKFHRQLVRLEEKKKVVKEIGYSMSFIDMR